MNNKTPTLVALLAATCSLVLAPAWAGEATVTVKADSHSITVSADANKEAAKQDKAAHKPAKPAAPAVDPESGAGADEAADEPSDAHESHHHDDAVVAIGSDANLAAGKSAEAVVAVFGNANNAGEAREAVVAVLGDATSTGSAGEAVVSILGTAKVDGPVHGGVVALGTVELGPNAVVDGDVVTVGGPVIRDANAVVTGNVQEVNVFGPQHAHELGMGLRLWVKECLLRGRPLAFAPGLGWAWGIAAVYLASYLLIALLFPAAMYRCIDTMEQRPGRTLVASILAVPLKWVAIVLLVITGIGILLLPFAALGLWIASSLGKAAAFAWIGRRVLPDDGQRRTGPLLLATLVGALIATAFYVVPFVGFLMHKALAVLGLGIVVYTLVQHWFPDKPAAARPASGSGTAAPASDAPASDAPAGNAPAAEAAPAGATPAGAAPAATAQAVPLASLERAGFWLRMAALAIDLVIVGVVWNFLPLSDHHSMLLAVAIYGAVMWKLRGTTVGGIVCHLGVRRLDGRPLDWSTSIVRALGCFLSLLVAGLGFIWIAFDREKQGWHDKIAGTVVVREQGPRPLV